MKSHAKKMTEMRWNPWTEDVEEVYDNLCGIYSGLEYYSENPTCKRCRQILRLDEQVSEVYEA